MRLGTCIALELAVMAGAIGGVWFGVGYAVELAGDYVGAREAAAATATTVPATDRQLAAAVSRLPRAELEVAPPAPVRATNVFGQTDEALLAPLGATPIVRVKPNKGGLTLSLRVDFASGARALFKPQQIHPQDPLREIAAYRLDRLLAIGHVPPAKPVKLTVHELIAAADPQFRTYTTGRITGEVIARKGEVRGMMSWWIPEIRDATLGEHKVDEPAGMQLWASYLQVGATIPPEHRALVEQIAAVVLFDVVIDNYDRWSGANAKSSPDGKTLYFMDNTLSFSKFKHGHEVNLGPLRRIQVFPRGLVGRLRTLSVEKVKAALDLGDDAAGIGALLTDEELRAIISRRNHVIEHIDALIAEHGEDRVLALP